MDTIVSMNRSSEHLQTTRRAAGLSLRELARLAGTSHATLSQYEQGHKTPSVEVFLRVLEAAGYSVDLLLRKRIRERRGMPRGEELAQVLELAEQFPVQASAELEFPRFGR